MKSKISNRTVKVSADESKGKERIIYPLLIFAFWLVACIICQFIFPHRLVWDEVAYLSVARGIAEDFDFGSRAYTIMGILNDGYPTHFIHYPLFPIYVALFFKLFGVSLTVGYFSTWFAALGVCLLIYFIFLLLSENNYKLAFIAALSYLFYPSILKNCDSAMMEQFGCFLLCLSTYLILKDYVKGSFTYWTVLKFIFSFLILWSYKTIFIGFLIGSMLLIWLAYSPQFTGKKLSSKIPMPVFIFLSFGVFAVLFYMFKQFVFYPVTPLMNYSPEQEIKQAYADFLGGLFNDFPNNLLSNIKYFFNVIIGSYFIYPTNAVYDTSEYANFKNSILVTSSYYVLDCVYFFFFLLMIIFTCSSWKKLNPQEKLFTSFTLFTIVVFNVILCLIVKPYHENLWRYNMYYLPLYLCTLCLLLGKLSLYFKSYITEHPKATIALLVSLFVFLYIPLFLSSITHYLYYESVFHLRAKQNDELIKSFVKDTKPKFVYFKDGIHTTFTNYPIKQVAKDATNDQLLHVNKILPEPIEFLFLRPNDWLYENNKESIVMGGPILNNQYKLYGFSRDGEIIVYRFDKTNKEIGK